MSALSDTSSEPLLSHAVKIVDWLAWAPGLETKEQWSRWGESGVNQLPALPGSPEAEVTPPVRFLPLGMRKKLSGTTKISLWLAHNIVEDDEKRSKLFTVFASRHGESFLTVDLLEEIAKNAPLSPMAFSRSVHNTASGLFGTAEQNTESTTAIAAMENTFEMGFISAVSQLDKHNQVLYIMADDVLPDVFRPYLHEPWGKYGIALVLEKSDKAISLPKSTPEMPDAISFIKELL